MKGVIFDLDGVLVSTDELHYKAWKKLAEELGITDFTKEDDEKQRGVSRMESLEVVLGKGTVAYTQEEKEALAEQKNTYYKEFLQELTQDAVLPGVFENLKFLRERGILIGVGSVSKNTPMILEKTGLKTYIDKVSCGLDITKSKPDPEVFLVAAQKLGLSNEECLVVEDSAAGIVAAKAAGMKSLGVGPYYQELGATYQARGLNEVTEWDRMLA
ncbi:MAG: beta-phosphoglucomutase [Lachnospiraceae bacterium]|nr:beta-phosphoglucomutase [Lachnospiraceae bacterium]MDE7200581.1 beta-phosphoglucomutase [Lachnospiraceae bacterium]